MPNDTAPEKTGSSENGDEAGRRNLLCDLADEQLRRNNRLAEIEFRRIVERSPARRIPFQCLPLPGFQVRSIPCDFCASYWFRNVIGPPSIVA
jgi:hypothetical protein